MRKITKEHFPPMMQHMYEKNIPDFMYLEGESFWLDEASSSMKYLCIVGSRKYTDYGEDACRHLIAGLAGYDVTIVSGMAVGIDSIAHEAALDMDLKTIAFPGSGLGQDVLYPPQHRGLAEIIVKMGGALLSEYEPNFHAQPWMFPARNRLMAGAAHATLIIEAEKKSGTAITARLALSYFRDVFVVPGSIFSHASEGTNALIIEGAHPVTSSQEIIELMQLQFANKKTFV